MWHRAPLLLLHSLTPQFEFFLFILPSLSLCIRGSCLSVFDSTRPSQTRTSCRFVDSGCRLEHADGPPHPSRLLLQQHVSVTFSTGQKMSSKHQAAASDRNTAPGWVSGTTPAHRDRLNLRNMENRAKNKHSSSSTAS